MATHHFPAMGTVIRVLAPRDRARCAAQVVEGVFAEWEDSLSRFRPESELSRVNAHAGNPVPVGRILLDTTAAALAAAHATGGLFDPLLQTQLGEIGYDRPFEEIRDGMLPLSAPPRRGGGWRKIVLDRASGTVTVPAGHGLDLAGIAKGMAVDESIERFRDSGIGAGLVSAGGDLRVLGLPVEGCWDILVGEDPDGPVVGLRRGALATSGTARRRWHQDGEARHHLLDPRTGLPAQSGLEQVTVAASTCRVAEVAATAAFVAGPSLGRGLLRRHGVAGLLVTDTGRAIPVGRWPRQQPARAA